MTALKDMLNPPSYLHVLQFTAAYTDQWTRPHLPPLADIVVHVADSDTASQTIRKRREEGGNNSKAVNHCSFRSLDPTTLHPMRRSAEC